MPGTRSSACTCASGYAGQPDLPKMRGAEPGAAQKRMGHSSAKSRDSELTGALQHVGFPRNEASVLAYLSSAGTASFREIEDATRLHVSNVRTALKGLKARGLVDDLEVQRRGRPARLYRLRPRLYDIAVHLEEMQMQRIAELGRSIERLNKLGLAGQ